MKMMICLFLFIQIIFFQQISYSSDLEKVEYINKSMHFKNPDAEKTIIIDNVFGSVKVTGYEGDEIQLNIRKTIKASSKNKIETAEEKVKLEITEDDNTIEFFVDGPFRYHNHKSKSWRGYSHNDYAVYFDFDLKIPHETNIEVRTVNDGDITIYNVEGDYNVNHVNGSIDMDKISGSGDVYTVNGSVNIDFKKNPGADCRFGSLNGEVTLNFMPKLDADFHLKTFNGEFFSDFPVSHLPAKAKISTEGNLKKTYKLNKTTNVRIGSGGPVINLDGFNGDMYILSKE